MEQNNLSAAAVLAQIVQLMQQYAGMQSAPAAGMPQSTGGEDPLTRLQEENRQLQSRLQLSQQDMLLERALLKAGCRNTTAAKALVQPQWLEGEQALQPEEIVQALMEEAPYLFEEPQPLGYRPVAGQGQDSEEALREMIRKGLRGEM